MDGDVDWMIILASGVVLTQTENRGINHVRSAPETHFRGLLADWVTKAKEDLITDWEPILFADESVTELPASTDGKVDLILARSDYRTRLQQDAAQRPPEPLHQRFGPYFSGRTADGTTTTLFASGIEVTDRDGNALLAYYQHLDEAMLGAILGNSNRGKKLMISKYEPIIRADPSVTTMPATEDGLIAMIVARSDYVAA
jgi:hypothetical protein